MKQSTLLYFIVLFVIVVNNSNDAGAVEYQIEIQNTWSEITHPENFPNDAHFSWFGGATHNNQISFWNIGEIASPGIKEMAETGETVLLGDEVQAEINSGNANQHLDYQWWFCPAGTNDFRCGVTTVEIDVTRAFPLITLVSMVGPSPDWFVGISSISLLAADRSWKKQIAIDLRPFDAGTREANRLELFGPLTDPPEAISEITTESGRIIGPDSLGTMTITLKGTFIDPIALQLGWNLVSVSEESTMLPNLSVGDQIWGWNAEKKNFSIHKIGTPFKPMKGYWVYASNETIVDFMIDK